MQAWSTDHCSQDQRFSYWREVLCQAFVSLDPVHTTGDMTGFKGDVNSRALSRTAQNEVVSSAHLVQCGWSEIRRNPVEFCFANFQLRGACVVRQDGQESLVRPGDFSIVDTTRPYALDFLDEWEVLSFRIPSEQLLPRLSAPRRAMARCVAGSGGAGLVASRFAHSLRQLGPDAEDAVQEGLSTALNSTIAAALGATLAAQEGDRPSVRQALRQAIDTYIADHLAEPSLGPDMLAARFRISRRTLYALYEDTPQSVGALIRELRLQRTARDLHAPDHPGVLAVAVRWGFNDASHFARLFKRRFGVSPRDHAAAAAAGEEPVASGL